MKMNRLYILPALALALALLLTGCMNDAGRYGAGAPSATPDYMPGSTQSVEPPMATLTPTAPADTSGTTGGALTPFDWANNASQIENAIDRISEIRESRVVVTGTTALVGVKFDNVYKGQLTERIRQLVAAEVLRADPAIQTVAVTSDAGDVQKVYALADQIRAGRTADDLAGEINAIVRNAATMR